MFINLSNQRNVIKITFRFHLIQVRMGKKTQQTAVGSQVVRKMEPSLFSVSGYEITVGRRKSPKEGLLRRN